MNNEPTTGSKLLRGAAVLGAAALISKIIGSLQKIPFQNIAGEKAFAHYNTAYPLYILILFVATAGFPVTVSKFVSERVVAGDYYGARRVLKIASVAMTITGISLFLLMYLAADWIAELAADPKSALSIRSVSFALIIVPVMAVLRGYFQGLQNMIPTGISQVIEQIIRVGTMVALTYWLVNQGYTEEWTSAGATFGAVTGSVAGLLVMLYYWLKHNRDAAVVKPVEPLEPTMEIAKKILWFALPICLGAIVLPILNLVDAFTVMRFLMVKGYSEGRASELWGIYNHGLPLTQLVGMFASSLSVALVPSISEAFAKRENKAISIRTNLAMRLTLLISLPASVGLAVLAEPVNTMLYKTGEGSLTIAILAFTTLFSTLNIISAGILQGLGAVTVPAKNLLVSAIVKAILNVILVYFFGIAGAAVSSVIAFAVASYLNMHAIRRHTGVSFSFMRFMYKPMVASLLMAVTLYIVMEGMELGLSHSLQSERLLNTLISATAIPMGMLVYGIALFRSGAINRGDLEAVPRFSRRLVPLLEKLRLLPMNQNVEKGA